MADTRFEDNDDPNVFWDVVTAPFRGVLRAGQSVYNLTDMLTFDLLPDAPGDPDLIPKSQTTAGNVVEGVSQFLTGFIPIAGQLGRAGAFAKAGKYAKYARSTVAGATADFVAFDAQGENLSSLLRQHTELNDPVTAFLAASDDDHEAVGRFKNALEGLGLGLAADGLFRAVKSMKAGFKTKSATNDPEATMKAVSDDIGDEPLIPEKPEPIDPPPAIKEDPVQEAMNELDEFDPDAEIKPDPTTPEVAEIREMVDEIANAKDWNEVGRGKRVINRFIKDTATYNTVMREVETAIKNNQHLRLQGTNEEMAAEATRVVEQLSPQHRKVYLDGSGVIADAEETYYRVLAFQNMVADNVEEMKRIVRDTQERGEAIKDNALIGAQLERVYDLIQADSAVGRISSRQLGSRMIKNRKFKDNFLSLEKGKVEQSKAFLRDRKEKWIKEAMKIIEEGGDPEEVTKKILGVAEGTAGGKLDMLREYWINNILSGLPTQAANILGNAITLFMSTGEMTIGHMLQGRMDLAKVGLKSIFDLDMYSEALKWAKKSAMTDRQYLLPESAAFREGSQQHSITGENIGRAIGKDLSESTQKTLDDIATALRFPGRGLTTADEFFKQLHARRAAKYKATIEVMAQGVTDPKKISQLVNQKIDRIVTTGGELYSEKTVLIEGARRLQARGYQNGTAEFYEQLAKYRDANFDKDKSALAEYAKDVAQELTFTKDLSSGGQAIQNVIKEYPALSFIMPFIRTPMNIMQYAWERAALGEFAHLTDSHNTLVKQFFSEDPVVSAAARGRFTTTLVATSNLFGAMYAYRDSISGGGPVDPKKKQALIDTGWQPYSIKIGDKWVSYQRLDPLATIIGVMVDIRDGMDQSNYGFNDSSWQKVLTTVLTVLQRNVTNKSYLSGVEMFVDAMSDTSGNKAERMLANIGSGMIPYSGLLKHSQAVVGDQEAREIRNFTDRAMRNNIPGMRQSLDPKRNILGEVKITEGLPVVSAFSPVTWSTQKKDPLLDEFKNLNHAFRQVDPEYGGILDLLEYSNDKGQSAHDRRLELIGTTQIGGKNVRQALERLIKSKRYQSLDPRSEPGLTSPRVREINKILTKYRSKALQQTLSEFPELARYHKEFTRAKRNQRRGQAMDELLQTLNF